MESRNINLLIDDYITELNKVTQNCNLPIAVVYLALQNLTQTIEQQYMATINSLAMQENNEKEYIIDLTQDELSEQPILGQE